MKLSMFPWVRGYEVEHVPLGPGLYRHENSSLECCTCKCICLSMSLNSKTHFILCGPQRVEAEDLEEDCRKKTPTRFHEAWKTVCSARYVRDTVALSCHRCWFRDGSPNTAAWYSSLK